MPSHRFFAYAERLLSYAGALQLRAKEEAQQQQESTRTNEPSRAAVVAAQTADYTDDGRRIVDGVALDTDGVPSWVRHRGKPTGEVEIIPGTPGALALSPAFAGQFSYAAVAAPAETV